MNAFQRMNTALMIDESKKIFKVSRRAFVDPDILEAERAQIFDKCWLYLGHSSEIAKPGDFVTRSVGGRSILFARDGKGELKAMLNTCPHRGAQVCREKHGSAKSFQCFYHGWVFGAGWQAAKPARRDILCRGLQGAQHLQHAAGAAL